MLGKILLPIDLAEAEMTRLALDGARVLAQAFHSELRLVNVRSVVPIAFLDYVPEDFDRQIRDGIEKEMAAFADEIGYARERVSTKVLFGPIHHMILAEAEDWGADMILLCSHRPGMARFLMGSTASAIVQRAKCSVWVVRPGG